MKIKKKILENENVIYHSNTSSIVSSVSTYNISYTYQELLEEPTNKEVLPFVKEDK